MEAAGWVGVGGGGGSERRQGVGERRTVKQTCDGEGQKQGVRVREGGREGGKEREGEAERNDERERRWGGEGEGGAGRERERERERERGGGGGWRHTDTRAPTRRQVRAVCVLLNNIVLGDPHPLRRQSVGILKGVLKDTCSSSTKSGANHTAR